MECRPLTDDLRPDSRVLNLILGDPGELIGSDVADAVAAGLNAMHLDGGELRQNFRRLFQLRPVVLNVLPRGEVSITFVVASGDSRQLAHLAR